MTQLRDVSRRRCNDSESRWLNISTIGQNENDDISSRTKVGGGKKWGKYPIGHWNLFLWSLWQLSLLNDTGGYTCMKTGFLLVQWMILEKANMERESLWCNDKLEEAPRNEARCLANSSGTSAAMDGLGWCRRSSIDFGHTLIRLRSD